MIIILDPEIANLDRTVEAIRAAVAAHPGVEVRPYEYRGTELVVHEIHLVGRTGSVPTDAFEAMPGVRRVVRVSARYRLIGRHHPAHETVGFVHNGVRFDESSVQLIAGLCAVDSAESADAMMAALSREGIVTTRMGVYKPRTSPYDFQGLGAACLPYVFELAGRHGIRLVAMEVTDARHVDEIDAALEATGNPTGVLLQVGTRNAQNFELLKAVGRQQRHPVLFKRGMGITLEESLNACEYIASEGNTEIVFCLRGVKTHLGEPHRNLVDFAHVPVVRRQTRLPVCIDPSHSTGVLAAAPDGVPDIVHVVGQGIVAGATAVLVDFHPDPSRALCDAGQALRLEQLGPLVEYVARVRETYLAATAAFAAPPRRLADGVGMAAG
jgi:3-deoxy-7-phosphoheptulonate synthase